MKVLSTLQQITPPNITRTSLRPHTNQLIHRTRRQTPSPPTRTWRLRGGSKGFTGTPKDSEPIAAKGNYKSAVDRDKIRIKDIDDDKIPDSVWKRMISRILFSVGVPLAIGFAFLQVFDVAMEKKLWDIPKWLPFLTTFITFGSSALGIAYGSLSTSLDAEEEGSFLGFEQVQKNWDEMWKDDEGL